MATGSVREPTKLYWDVRPSTKQETLEFRVADVCMGVDEAVMVAGLVRGLAFTCHQAAVAGDPDPRAPPRAAPGGQVAGRPPRPGRRPGGRARPPRPPATEMVELFLAEIRPGLEAGGDLEEVTELVRATIARGTARPASARRSSGPAAWSRWWTW